MAAGKKRISQETFDDAVHENMDDFGMSRQDAVKDAIEQFEMQVRLGDNIRMSIPLGWGTQGLALEPFAMLMQADTERYIPMRESYGSACPQEDLHASKIANREKEVEA